LLKLLPVWPGHFFHQLPVGVLEVCLDLVHFVFFETEFAKIAKFSFARALGFEPRSKVLETSILPLNYARS
jgi:hypothetical protein